MALPSPNDLEVDTDAATNRESEQSSNGSLSGRQIQILRLSTS